MLRRTIRQMSESYWLAAVLAALALPILMWPIAAEGFQHAVEFHLGMFSSRDGISQGFETYARAAAGAIKVFAMAYATIVATRFFVHGRNLTTAFRFEAKAKNAVLLGVFLLAAAFAVVAFGSRFLLSFVRDAGFDIPRPLVPFVLLLPLVLMMWPLQARSLQWTAAVLGDESFAPQRARALANRWAAQSILATMIAPTPAIVMHYALHAAAVDQPLGTQIAVLAADSILVGFIAALLGATAWVTYRDVRDRA